MASEHFQTGINGSPFQLRRRGMAESSVVAFDLNSSETL